MSIKLPLYFDDLKLHVELQTWTALVNSPSPYPIGALFRAGAEAIEKQGALIVYREDGPIMNSCNRIDELEALREVVEKTRSLSNLPPLAA